MTRTYIIDADGTRFEALSSRRALRNKILRRTIGGIALLITALFLSAAIIGLQRAAIAPDTLHEGDKITIDTNCWIEATDEAHTMIVHCD